MTRPTRTRYLVCTLTVLALSLTACGVKERRLEREVIEAEAQAADDALSVLKTDDALLLIARARDARRDPQTLYPLVRHADPLVRKEALRGISLIGVVGSRPLLEDGLQDPDPQVQAAAAFALSQMWAWELADLERATAMAETEEQLLEALAAPDNHPLVTRALLRALAEVGGETTDEAFWERLAGSGSNGDLLVAAALLAKRGKSEPLDEARSAALLAAWPEPPSWQVGYLVHNTGAAAGADELTAKLLADLHSVAATPDSRVWSLRALGKLGGPGADEALRQAISDGSFRDRIAAVRAAGSRGPDGVPLLLAALQDPSDLVVREAVSALGRSPTDDGVDALAAVAEVTEGATIRRTARLAALAGFYGTSDAPGDHADDVRAAALEASTSPEPKIRAAAWGLVGADPDPAAAETLLAATEVESDPEAKLALGLAVAGRPEEVVEGTLLTWLAGPETLLGAVAAEALGGRTGEHVTVRLSEAFAASSGPEEAERRLEIAKALMPREGVHPETVNAMLRDPEALVRTAAFAALAARVGRSHAGTSPQAREYPDLPDARFGVGDALEATISTNRGDMVIALTPDVAPSAVANFVTLAEDGFYDGLLFHRVVPDFVIQGGDPLGTGWGGPGWTIRDEFSATPYVRGTVGMARSGKDTAGSQWFITHAPTPHLEGHYTVFGQMILGWQTLDAIVPGDVIETITIRRRSEP